MKEKSVRTSLLLDFYGGLLTYKLRRTCESYFYEDLSLAEIAESESISRQGVHDTIRRAEKQLDEFENKLGLVALFEKQQHSAKRALELIKQGEADKAEAELAKLIDNM